MYYYLKFKNMEKCLNNDFEGKIIEIPGIEQDPNEFFFKYK